MNDKTDPIEPAAPISAANATVEAVVQPPASAATAKTGGVARSSAIFSAMTLLSRLAGFARDLVITAALGASAGPAADAYYTALNFPNLFRRIFAEGAFAAAFVPAYAKTLKSEGEAAADKVATDALAAVAAVTVALTVVGSLVLHRIGARVPHWRCLNCGHAWNHDAERRRRADARRNAVD